VDRGLAHELAAGVLRNRSRLDAALVPLVTAPWMRVGDDTKDLLRLGAWQVIGLDRVPEYAAVNDTVEVAKQTVGTKVSGLVNAVLRRLVREGVPPLPPDADLATRFSHPSWLVARWVARYGPANTSRLLEHNNRAPAVHVRPTRWTHQQLVTAFAEADIPFDETDYGLAVRGRRVTDLPGFAEGGFIVQDPAQGSVVAFAAIPE
jgi:16S rRNA (cytosine967-C5)-methyltransferase